MPDCLTCATAAERPGVQSLPMSSEYGTYETVKAIFWPLLSGESPYNFKGVPYSLGSGIPVKQLALARVVKQLALAKRVVYPGVQSRIPASQRPGTSARKRESKIPWREAGPPNHLDDTVDSDQ